MELVFLNRYRSQGTVRLWNQRLFPEGTHFFLFAKASNLALGSTQLPISWVPETLARLRRGWGVNLTPHLHLVPILRLSGLITLLPLKPWWRVRWLHYLCFSLKINNFFTAGASKWYILGVWQKDFVLCACVCVCASMWARQLQGGQCVSHRDILQLVPTRHHALGLHLRRSRSKISPSHKCISETGK